MRDYIIKWVYKLEVDMNSYKRKLDYDEQINYLKNKGVLFNIVSEKEAKDFLIINNNYFKLTSYRKNYNKYQGGKLAGKYIDLEFAYLKDLSSIDKEMRYVFIHMSLDIEHFIKVYILRLITESEEDGYSIVDEFKEYLCEKYDESLDRINGEIDRGKQTVYNKDLVEKYQNGMPVWVYVEIIPFGRLISFCKFCSEKFVNKELEKMFYLLRACKEIRNAAAHNSCIINDLHVSRNNERRVSVQILQDLYRCEKLSKTRIRQELNNERIRQIVTLLYTYKKIVKSDKAYENIKLKLEGLIERIYRNEEYYRDNVTIKKFFDFFEKVVEFWY